MIFIRLRLHYYYFIETRHATLDISADAIHAASITRYHVAAALAASSQLYHKSMLAGRRLILARYFRKVARRRVKDTRGLLLCLMTLPFRAELGE